MDKNTKKTSTGDIAAIMGIMGVGFFMIAVLAIFPFLTLCVVAQMESFEMLFYLIWIILCIISVKHSRSETLYGKFTIAIMLTVLFDMIFYFGIISDLGIDKSNYEDVLSFLMAPFLSLIPIAWVGYKLRDKPVDTDSEALEEDTEASEESSEKTKEVEP